MTPERTLVCYALAVVTALVGAAGAQVVAGFSTGSYARAFSRELVDLPSYWLLSLPLCYLVAGVLGYLGPVRTWRWIVTMMAVQALYMVITAGSGLSLLPFMIVMVALISLPGIVAGRVGGNFGRARGTSSSGSR